jgi:restriction endonuclease S subunit
LVKRGAVGERFDADYQRLINSTIFNFKFPLRTVETMFSIKDGDHNKLPEEEISDISNGIRYLRVQDLKEGQIISENPIYISKRYYNSITRSHIKSGYILFSIMASVGSVAVFPENLEDCTANRAVGILIPKLKNIDSYYFQAFCNTTIGYKLFETLKKGGVQQRINLSDIAKLKIPVPPLEIQSQIVEIFNTAYTEKRKKEAEAKELLASIDAYLLEQLGIVLPDKVEEKNVFYVPFSKVQGNRFDPFYNKDEFEINSNAVSKGKYRVETIKEIGKNLIKGRLPKDSEKDGNCKVVQINSVNIDGSINLEDLLTAKPIFTHNQLLQENDVLIVITGATIGKISFWQYEGEYYLGGDIVKFQCNEGVNPYYIYSYLRTQIIQTEIKNEWAFIAK